MKNGINKANFIKTILPALAIVFLSGCGGGESKVVALNSIPRDFSRCCCFQETCLIVITKDCDKCELEYHQVNQEIFDNCSIGDVFSNGTCS